MSNSDKDEAACRAECLGNANCGGFVFMNDASSSTRCRPKASSCTEASQSGRKYYKKTYSKGFTDRGAKQCPTTATGMSNSNKDLEACAEECDKDTNCGGFVLMDDANSSTRCRPKAASCTEGDN